MENKNSFVFFFRDETHTFKKYYCVAGPDSNLNTVHMSEPRFEAASLVNIIICTTQNKDIIKKNGIGILGLQILFYRNNL